MSTVTSTVTYTTMKTKDTLPPEIPPAAGALGVAKIPWDTRSTFAQVEAKFPNDTSQFVRSVFQFHNAVERSYDGNRTFKVKKLARCNNVLGAERPAEYRAIGGDEEYVVTRNFCTCKAFLDDQTPCKHMARILRFEGVTDAFGVKLTFNDDASHDAHNDDDDDDNDGDDDRVNITIRGKKRKFNVIVD